MFTTQEQYLKAKEELEVCHFKDLLEEYQDAPEFCEPLLMIANYRDGRQTPSPKKEVFKKATAAQRKDLRKINYRGPVRRRNHLKAHEHRSATECDRDLC
ncbi:unnamed protein product [Caenorhabditis brenneri]